MGRGTQGRAGPTSPPPQPAEARKGGGREAPRPGGPGRGWRDQPHRRLWPLHPERGQERGRAEGPGGERGLYPPKPRRAGEGRSGRGDGSRPRGPGRGWQSHPHGQGQGWDRGGARGRENPAAEEGRASRPGPGRGPGGRRAQRLRQGEDAGRDLRWGGQGGGKNRPPGRRGGRGPEASDGAKGAPTPTGAEGGKGGEDEGRAKWERSRRKGRGAAQRGARRGPPRGGAGASAQDGRGSAGCCPLEPPGPC